MLYLRVVIVALLIFTITTRCKIAGKITSVITRCQWPLGPDATVTVNTKGQINQEFGQGRELWLQSRAEAIVPHQSQTKIILTQRFARTTSAIMHKLQTNQVGFYQNQPSRFQESAQTVFLGFASFNAAQPASNPSQPMFSRMKSSQERNFFICTPTWMYHICFFDHPDERNAMVKSILHFDNFGKSALASFAIWPSLYCQKTRARFSCTILAVNRC